MAPIILATGLLYLDRYKQGLIRSELAGLTTQAEMLAGAVGEGAVAEQALGFLEINQDLAQHMVRRLAKSAQIRARLFDAVGGLAADSRFLLSPKGNIRIEDLEPPHGIGLLAQLNEWWQRASTWMPLDESLPVHLEPPQQRAEHFPEAVAALSGRTWDMVRTDPAGGIILSAAVPVQRYKQVVGALMVSHDGSRVARALFQVRLAIAEAFLVSLAVTIGLSLYMAGTIARPIRRLAVAAELVRHGRGRARAHVIPDLSARGDEIGELSVALKEMTEALWARMDAIERFAADVSHEIKNPLTSVRSAVETAARIHDPEKQKKLLSIIQDDVERLNRLITDISDASRVDAEMSRADTQTVDLTLLLETLVEVYRATEENLTFALDLPANDRLNVEGIESRLVQVLRNLIGNAISFSPADGTIRLTASRNGKMIRLSIEDDGPGIPTDKLAAIFDRFYSERPVGEKFGTHSGLGLSISKQIIDAHDGRIWAENRTGGGARFVVELKAPA